MDKIAPWRRLCGVIEPIYPKAGNGRPPIGLDRKLRIYFLQHWFTLSDPTVEDALYDSSAMRSFAGIDLGREPAPDATPLCRFRRLLEKHDLGVKIFAERNTYLADKGAKATTGTIVDAAIIAAPSSTKNAQKEHPEKNAQKEHPELHQTKKGNERRFGAKVQLGVDSKAKVIRSLCTTPANVADSAVLGDLLHRDETRIWGDQADRGQTSVIKAKAPRAQDHTHRRHRHKGVVNVEEREKPDQVQSPGEERAPVLDHQACL
jgi:IS5 family transposase